MSKVAMSFGRAVPNQRMPPALFPIKQIINVGVGTFECVRKTNSVIFSCKRRACSPKERM